ncbi:MAG TPA: carboxy-S-adenosyl-L-methionine synthase CmoA [Sedimenticola thiotaurini]|uniref:Carboxy-S-adenosyl-L-methionine synthase n=1 Tax=Sedimenticola thiotaurini TaxID=1543721 RepID=A0A831RPC0_9GAMM|nr:carboxy-S-adenosyl-L-methionine synthase CmoA [Sedimenticola thiotaurini]
MSHSGPRDRLYRAPLASVDGFRFDERVARVFPDMIRRSVPGYGTVLNMIRVLAGKRVQAGSRCYDLGCSLGAAALAMAEGAAGRDCHVVGIDNSPAMLARARELVAGDAIDLVCADICDFPITDASMVVLNFTLQFVPPPRRQELLRRIRQGLRPGGILVLSEKIAFDDPELQQRQVELHHAFKRANGYDELEISQKRSALERVLIPETLESHRERLRRAGFRRADPWFQCFNFISLVALP